MKLCLLLMICLQLKGVFVFFQMCQMGQRWGGMERSCPATTVRKLLSVLKWLQQNSILFQFVGILYNTSTVPWGIKINKCRLVHWRITIVFFTQTTHVLSLMSGPFFFNASSVYQWNITFQINWFVVWITMGKRIKQVLDLRWFICIIHLRFILSIQACVKWAAIIYYDILDPPILQSLSKIIIKSY